MYSAPTILYILHSTYCCFKCNVKWGKGSTAELSKKLGTEKGNSVTKSDYVNVRLRHQCQQLNGVESTDIDDMSLDPLVVLL